MLGVPTQRQRQVRCQRCPADLLKLPHECSDCMTFVHRLLRVYEMISGANCSGNDVRFAAHSGVALDIAPCPKCTTTDLSIATQRQRRHSTSAKSACSCGFANNTPTLKT